MSHICRAYFFKSFAIPGKLRERGLEVFDDFSSDHIGIGKIGAVFKAS
jgi:hypothetical protein